MKIIGSIKRLSIGGWILGAVAVAGFNAFAMTALFSPPVVGRSKETRLASQKWFKLENRLKLLEKDSYQDIDRKAIAKRFVPDIPVIKPKPVQSEKAAQPDPMSIQVLQEQPVELPILSGIMEVVHPRGHVRFFALIEGKKLRKGDIVRQFKIDKISQNGVVLSKDGKTWSLPAPEVYFSIDRESAGQKIQESSKLIRSETASGTTDDEPDDVP